MKILITGANGFVAHYLIQQFTSKNIDVLTTAKDTYKGQIVSPYLHFAPLDFTNAVQVNEVIDLHKPTHIIHAGAISKPDVCEENKEQAFNINVNGTKNLLNAANKIGAYFLLVSTDFVFDGEKGMYKEDDERKAVNYYGQTKIFAEDEVMKYSNAWSIVRTVLVYGKPLSGRDNILTIVAQKLKAGEGYSVFDDQVRTPTYVEDLAKAIVQLTIENKKGIYHISGETIVTPYQMAVATANYLNLDSSLIKKVTAQTFTQPALRPPKTGFYIAKAKKEINFIPISFEEGLRKTLED